MLKAILASFIGTFLALAAIGLAGVVVAERVTDRIVADVSERVNAGLAQAREQMSAAVARIEERAGAARQTLADAAAGGTAKAALAAALGGCLEAGLKGGETPEDIVRKCLEQNAPGAQ